MSEESMASGSEGLSVSNEIDTVVGPDSESSEETEQEELETSEEEGEEISEDEVEEELEDASKKEIEKAKENLKKKYKLKVDGREVEEEFSDEDIVRELQLAKKARKEIQQSATLRKEVEGLLELLKNNPEAVLSDPLIGIDPIEFAQRVLSKRLEEESKDPSVREKEKLEQELEELRSKMKSDEEQRQEAEYQREVARAERDLEDQVTDALETSGLPKSPYILKKMADIMLSAMNNGIEISPKQAINVVRKEMTSDIKSLFDSSPDDMLEQLLGSNNIKRLNKKSLSRLKKTVPTANSIRPTGKIVENTEGKEDEKVQIKDWLRRR